jgi:pyruvate,orthophosphate dikinase
LAKQTGNERFAYDSYRRFVQMFGKIVLDIDGELFEEELDKLRTRGESRPIRSCRRRTSPSWSRRSRGSCKQEAGVDFPQDPKEQLRYAIEAVFKSWNGKRARDYRRSRAFPTTSAPP